MFPGISINSPSFEVKECSPCVLENLSQKALNALSSLKGGEGFPQSKTFLLGALEEFRSCLRESDYLMASATVEMMICAVRMAQDPEEVALVLTPRHLNGVLIQADAECRRKLRC